MDVVQKKQVGIILRGDVIRQLEELQRFFGDSSITAVVTMSLRMLYERELKIRTAEEG